MSKLPISAFHPNGTPNLFQAHIRNSTRMQGSHLTNNIINRTAPTVTLAENNNLSSPVVLCVEGVLLWLLIAWITAGTAAIITLLIKSCRNRCSIERFIQLVFNSQQINFNSRWKHVEEEEFDWGGLERSRPATSQHTRSTSCSSAPSIRPPLPTPKPSVPPPTPSRFSQRASSRYISTFKLLIFSLKIPTISHC